MSERQPENKNTFKPLVSVEEKPTPSPKEHFDDFDRALLNLSVSENTKMSKPPAPLTSDELLRPITDKYAELASQHTERVRDRHTKVLRAAAGLTIATTGLSLGNYIATEINKPDIETAYVYQEPAYVENFDGAPPEPDAYEYPYGHDQLNGDKPSYPESIPEIDNIDPSEQPGDPYDNPPPYPVEEPAPGPVEQEEYYYSPNVSGDPYSEDSDSHPGEIIPEEFPETQSGQ